MSPALCFGNPCEMLSASSQDTTVVSDASKECPISHDSDGCELSCCCAGHIPLSAFIEITYADLVAKLFHVPHQALPRLLDRIFVPPENLV